MIDPFPTLILWILYINFVLLLVLGCVGGAFVWFALTGHTEILQVMERYRTASVQVPAELIRQNQREKKETNKDGYTRTWIVYEVLYRYQDGTTGTNVVREFESPQELRKDGFAVSVLLPDFPKSGLPSQYIQEMSASRRRSSSFAGVVRVLISIVGVACMALPVYAFQLFKVTGILGLSLMVVVFLVVGKLMADQYLIRWKRKLLETVVEDIGIASDYGSTNNESSEL